MSQNKTDQDTNTLPVKQNDASTEPKSKFNLQEEPGTTRQLKHTYESIDLQVSDSIITPKKADKSTLAWRAKPTFWVQYYIPGHERLSKPPPLYHGPNRNAFVRLAFSIVLFMLFLTICFVMLVYMTIIREVFLKWGLPFLIGGLVGILILNFAFFCMPCTRKPPGNFICLVFSVICLSLITASLTAQYETQVILLGLLATAAVVFLCLCLACTNFDFTKLLLYLIVMAASFGMLSMMLTVTMLATNTNLPALTFCVLVGGTLINCIVLVIELQIILGGKVVRLSEEDYALGAFLVYCSIIEIFLQLIQIIGMVINGTRDPNDHLDQRSII